MTLSTASNNELDALAIEADAREGEAVLHAVHAFVGRYVAYPNPHAQVAHALWIAHTHCIKEFHTTPRLAFMSAEPASGKTRALEVTELLVPGALLSFNLSPAALIRKVAEGGCTVLYDEVDALFGSGKREEENLDVRSVINSGYRRGARCYRCTMAGRKVEVEELDAFAAVAVAGLRNLPDSVASRAIIIRMRRRAPDERVEQFRIRRVVPIGEVLRLRLGRWCMDLRLEDAEPEMPSGIVDRAAECWEPLLMIADAAGGDWARLARAAAVHFVQGGREESTSIGVELLEHIREAFGADKKLWTDTLLDRLHDLPESPWKDLDGKGKKLDDRGLARQLRGFGIKSKQVKLEDTNRRGYETEQFADTWRRYLPLNATSATSATKLISQNNLVADVADVAFDPAMEDRGKSNGADRVCAQCGDSTPGLDPYKDGARLVWLHPECRPFYLQRGQA